MRLSAGMLTDADGLPLRIQAFERSKAEPKTFLPSVKAIMHTCDLHGVTVIADAGMISDTNRRDLDTAGLSYVLGGKTRELLYPVWTWRNDKPGDEYTHGQIWVTNDPGDPAKGIRPSRKIYHYSADRARRTVNGINESLCMARDVAEGKTPAKRNRYVQMVAITQGSQPRTRLPAPRTGGDHSVCDQQVG